MIKKRTQERYDKKGQRDGAKRNFDPPSTSVIGIPCGSKADYEKKAAYVKGYNHGRSQR